MKFSDTEYERRYLITVLSDEKVFLKVAEDRKYLSPYLFNLKGHQFIAALIDAIARKYSKLLPLNDSFRIIKKNLEKKVTDSELLQDYYLLLEQIIETDDEPESFQYLYDSLMEFSAARRVKSSLEETAKFLKDDKLEEAIQSISSFHTPEVSSTYMKAADVVHDYMDYRQKLVYKREHPEEFVGIPTGFNLIDNNEEFGGTHKGEMYLVLGFTKRGKSFVLLEVGYQAMMRGYNVVHVTIEMSAEKAQNRFFSRATGVRYDYLKEPMIQRTNSDGSKYWHERLTDEHFEELDKVASKMKDKEYTYKILSFNQGCTVADIERELKELTFNPDVVVIDHLPDMKPSPEFHGSSKSWDAIGDVSWEMSQLARNWNDQQGLVLWTANQVVNPDEFETRLSVQSCAYSRLPVTHASATVYIAQNEDDVLRDIRRFGVINTRDGGSTGTFDALVSNLAVSKLHDPERAKGQLVQQYLRKLLGDMDRS